MPRRNLSATLLTFAAALLAPVGSAHAGLPAYVVEQTPPSVQVVDATTGAKSELSAGNLLSQPTGIAIEPSGDLVVSDAGRRAVIRVDRDTGDQEYVTSGTSFGTPSGIAVRPNGDILVTDEDPAGVANLTFTNGALVKVDPNTGATTLLSYDNRFGNPVAVAAHAGGDSLVADRDGPANAGSVVRVNGTTSLQTNGAQGGTWTDPSGIAIERSGTWLVTDARAGVPGAVHRVTGTTPTELVENGILVDPRGIALERSGSALVADPGAGKLIRVAPADGALSTLNGTFTDPVAVAVPSDEDADSAADVDDNCVGLANADQANLDLDAFGNACDADDDNDGADDADETAAGTDPLDQDTDGDSHLDGADNCPLLFSASQADADADGTGDACDSDYDEGPSPMPPPATAPTTTEAQPAQGRPAPAFEQRVDTPITPQTPAATTPQPVLGKVVAAAGRSGRVTVRLPGHGEVELGADGQIPVGAIVDTTFGSVVLTSALPDGSVQSARFSGGRFTISQRSADGVTDLKLAGPAPRCEAGKKRVARAAAAKKRKVTKRLWGDGHGRFRTHGKDAVASVRGTKWLVEDTCRGTRVRVARGVVSVKNKRTTRSFLLRAGQSRLVER